MEHLDMVDLASTPEEMVSSLQTQMQGPSYPTGCSLCLTKDVIDKLGVDHTDWKIGDIFHLHALAKVTSIHEGRVELQITHLSGESENEENEEAEEEMEQAEGEEESEPADKPKSRPNYYF